MTGKLYGVGVGPGDPELMTLKAIKIIEKTTIIALPQTGEEDITAYTIASKVVDFNQKEILKLSMPMTKDKEILSQCHDEAARLIIERLSRGDDVAFLTLGDPTIYSTYMYIHKRVVDAGFQTQIVEGITSFCAAAARLNISLCEGSDMLHIIPATYGDDSYLDLKGTKVLMKSGKTIGKVKEKLKSRGLLEKAMMVECCTMENERVYKSLAGIDNDKSYFSIIVVKE